MTSDMRTTLVEMVKPELFVTWSDDATNQKIIRIVEDAETKLNHLLGAEMDYSVPGTRRTLFINYCIYAWNGITKDFKGNYMQDIYEVRRQNEVKQHAESKEVQ